MKFYAILWLLACVVAFVLRYFLPLRVGIGHYSSTNLNLRAMPLNVVGAWLILGIAAIITVIRSLVGLAHR